MLNGTGADNQLGAGLAQLSIARAGDLAGGIAPAAAVAARPLWRAAAALALLAAIVVVIAALAPRMARTQWGRFNDPFGDHPPYSRTLLSVKPGNVKVVYGGAVEIGASAQGGAVDNVDLVLQWPHAPQEVLPMFPEADGTWRAAVTNVVLDGQYFVRARGARSSRFDIGVLTVPQLGDVHFVIRAPAYTHLPEYRGPLPQGGIAALPGARIEVIVGSNRPLAGGTLEIPGAQAQNLIPTSPHATQVAGAFTVTSAGKIRISVRDELNQDSVDSFTAPVTLLIDARPVVRILEPKAVAMATPDSMIPVTLAAEDDYGISRLQLFRSLNESAGLPVEFPIPPQQPPRLTATAQLPLESYGLVPGDVIKLYAHVEDNDPAGAKGTDSSAVILRIISQEEFDRMLLAQAGIEALMSRYEAAERRLENDKADAQKLLDDLQKAPPDSEISKEDKHLLDDLTKRMEEDAGELHKAVKQSLPLDVDKAMSDQLEQLAKDLDELVQEAKQAQGLPAGAVLDRMAKVVAGLNGAQQQFKDQALDPLEYLSHIYPLIADQQHLMQMYQRQNDLAQRLGMLEGQDNVDDPQIKALMRDLESEQRDVREMLDNLMDDIEAHASALPQDARLDDLRQSALDMSGKLRSSGASDTMQLAEGALGEFAGTRAHAAGQRAADILETFVQRCRDTGGMGGMARQDLKFQPKLVTELGDTVEQMLAAGGGADSGLGKFGMYGKAKGDAANAKASGSNRGLAGTGPGGVLVKVTPETSDQGAASKGAGASGASNAVVPPQYQKRVGEYFRRVSDDMEQP